MTLSLRPARPGDAALIAALVRELADYEHLAHEAVATEADFDVALFGPTPRVFCDIAEVDGEPVGLALWFYTFSTFLGRHGIWLEDLFVRPTARGKGAGKALLAGLAARCQTDKLGRLEWWVLDWNAPSIAFYKAMGAVANDEWTQFRVAGPALERLAEAAR